LSAASSHEVSWLGWEGVVRDGVYLNQTGRRIPSLRMRAWSVVRFMPAGRRRLWAGDGHSSGEERGGCGGGRFFESGDRGGRGGEGSRRGIGAQQPGWDLSSDRGTRSSLPGERSTGAFMRFSSRGCCGPGIIRRPPWRRGDVFDGFDEWADFLDEINGRGEERPHDARAAAECGWGETFEDGK